MDDADPSAWKQPDVLAGDLSSGFIGVCTGYAERSLEGSLRLSEATAEDVAALSCLTSVGGNLMVYENPELESLAGRDKLASVGGKLAVIYNDAPCEEEVDDLLAQLVGFAGTAHTGANKTCP